MSQRIPAFLMPRCHFDLRQRAPQAVGSPSGENASASSEKKGRRRAQAETDLKGFANHRRLEFLDLLGKKPEMSVGEISIAQEIELKNASEHLRRLTTAGLILKRHEGREVSHALTPRARNIPTFLRM
ncbi:MAG: winged helix-turn-helix domain-containing protein [Verrucomicrobia bacterium]|nr:winged helix-turn-helix domain-containing protein [Verrucomicrobiota bacterium]